jgi:hypothetical protein
VTAARVARIDAAAAKLAAAGQVIERIDAAPWVPPFEARAGRRLPAAFRELIERWQYCDLECGGVVFYDNSGDGAEDSLALKPFADPFMGPWLLAHDLLAFGQSDTGFYDPVCIALDAGDDPPVVVLDHEDILLERKKVRRRTLATSFVALLEAAS